MLGRPEFPLLDGDEEAQQIDSSVETSKIEDGLREILPVFPVSEATPMSPSFILIFGSYRHTGVGPEHG